MREGIAGQLANWRIGPVEFSLRDPFLSTLRGEHVLVPGNVTAKLFARDDNGSFRRSTGSEVVSSVSIGATQIYFLRHHLAK